MEHCQPAPLSADERVTSMIRVPEFDEESYLVIRSPATASSSAQSSGRYDTTRKGGVIAIDLDEGDEVGAWVR